MTVPALAWLGLGGLLLTGGDIVFKYWTLRSLPILSFHYLVGLIIYIFGLICLIQSFKSQNIAVASAIFVIVNIITLALVSWFHFDEKLSAQQLYGMGFAILAIVLLR